MPHLDFCLQIAEDITSDSNQHSTLMIWAPTGKGKSWDGMAVGECVAQYVSEIKGGYPEDYFTPDNIAVITKEEVLRVMSTKMDKKYSVIGFDDIGLAWNSRDFMDEFNKCMNDIAQTIRTRNLFAYFTLPDPMLIDKVPRELIKYVMKVEKSCFDYYYTECKIQEPMKKVQWGKKIYPYLLDEDGQRIVRHIVFRPSKKSTDNYEPRRSQIEHQNTCLTVENMQQLVAEEATPSEPRISKKSLFSTPMKKLYEDKEYQKTISKKLSEGKLSMGDLKDLFEVSTQTVYEALHYQEPNTSQPPIESKKVA